MSTCTADVVIAQEVHALGPKLHEVQSDAMDVGWNGQWFWATSTAAGGSEGGFAVLARACILISQAPFLERGVVYAGRIGAAL
eukprot:5864620-Pyramimonas_sp.AAC.1